MAMRVTTYSMYTQGVAAMQKQMQAMARVQTQLSTGLRFQNAREDPIAAGRALNVEKALADLQRWQTNIGVANDRLMLEESALASSVSALDRIRELAIQANSDTLSDSDRASIAKEMEERLKELFEQANTRDGQGAYLFSGSRSDSRPFEMTPGGAVVYQGDTLQSELPIGSTRSIAMSDNGYDVFMSMTTGDGKLDVSASGQNTGAATVQDMHFTDSSQWDGGEYTVSFSGGQYSVADANGNVVSSGAYESQVAIQFNGVSITFQGDPADGDQFTLGPSQRQDVFATVNQLIGIVSATGRSPEQRAQDQTQLFNVLKSLDTAMDHLGNVRGGVGARLNAVDDARLQIESRSIQLQETLSGLRETDYIAASTELSQIETTLQAAQQSYLRIQGLSLFDYMK
jgi:flagellar hook-associated protein 3 FlgL